MRSAKSVRVTYGSFARSLSSGASCGSGRSIKFLGRARELRPRAIVEPLGIWRTTPQRNAAARAVPSSLQVTPASLICAQLSSPWVSQPSRAHNIPAPFSPGSRSTQSALDTSQNPAVLGRHHERQPHDHPAASLLHRPFDGSHRGRYRPRRDKFVDGNSTASSSPSPRSSTYLGFHGGPSLGNAGALSLLETDKPRTYEP